MRIIILLAASFLTGTIYAQPLKAFAKQLANSRQVLFVTTPTAASVKGEMVLYERKNINQSWRKAASFPIVVGRAGLVTDRTATIKTNTDNYKKEGDGKSPAGIFKLDHVFSYHALKGIKLPFVQVDSNFYCVDDPSSVYYNKLVVKDTARQPFNSFEYMKRKDDYYEYGIWVLHNSAPVVPENGSCIFIHVWQNDHTGTAGCTAMSKANILKLIRWVDQKSKPLLVQVVAGKRK